MNFVGTFGFGINRIFVKDIQIAQTKGMIRNTISKMIAGVEKSHANRDSFRR